MGQQLDEYKARVLEVAKRVKEENGWCTEGFNEVLRELDIEPPVERIKILVKFEVEVYADVKDGVLPEEFELGNALEDPDFDDIFRSTDLENVEVDDVSSWVEDVDVADED